MGSVIKFIKKFNDVDIRVLKEGTPSTMVRLNLKDDLSTIRKILQENLIIRMNDTLSFAEKISHENDVVYKISREDEEQTILSDLIKKNGKIIYIKKYIKIKVQIVNTSSTTSVFLSLNNNLLNIRKVLERNSRVKMNNTLLFMNKDMSEIAREDEKDFILNDVIKINHEDSEVNHVLYLKKNPTPDWESLNELRRLDYGCTLTIDEKGSKRAQKRAVEMKGCKMMGIGAEGCRDGKIEYHSEEDWIRKNNLFFTADANLEDFFKF